MTQQRNPAIDPQLLQLAATAYAEFAKAYNLRQAPFAQQPAKFRAKWQRIAEAVEQQVIEQQSSDAGQD